MEQVDFRRATIEKALADNNIDPDSLDAICARGGQVPYCAAGTYRVDQAMVDFMYTRRQGAHASNLGCVLALLLAKPLGIPAYIVDPVMVDEMDDVARVKDNFRQVVYNQRESVTSKEGSTVYVNEYSHPFLVICSREAGHTAGGAIWDIQTETDNIIYSMNINPLSDNHLRGASYKTSGNTSILITDACGQMSERRVDYRQKERAQYGRFSYLITDTLRDKKGNVLIPVESTGRCPEIILMLERIWEESRLDSFKVYFLTK